MGDLQDVWKVRTAITYQLFHIYLKMFFRFLLFLLFTVFHLFVFAQMKMPESRSEAWGMLNGNLPDSNRQVVYNYLAELYLNYSESNNKFLDSTFYYARKGVYLIDSINKSNSKTTNEILFILGLARRPFCNRQKNMYAGNKELSTESAKAGGSKKLVQNGKSFDHFSR